MSPRRRRIGEKFRSLYLWHRYAGLAAALLVVWLAVTGLVLNHADDLQLADRHVEQPWLLSLYNIEAPEGLAGRRIGAHWLTQSGDRVYLDAKHVATGSVAGGAQMPSGFVIALRDRLLLFTDAAELVEDMPFTASAAPIRGVHATAEGIVVATADQHFLADPDIMEFSVWPESAAATPPALEPLPPQLADAIARDVLHHALDWERVMLDLHAGRIGGRAGAWLADLAGVLLLLLAASGVIVWAQRARARRRHG